MTKHVLGVAMATVLAAGATMAAAQRPTSGAAQVHIEAARKAAGTDNAGLFDRTCNALTPPAETAPRAARPSGPPPRASWYAEPAKVFDNLYFLGQSEYSSWAVTTSQGIIIIDAIYDHGDLIGFAKIARDLTERREAEEQLRRSEELFRRLVEGVLCDVLCTGRFYDFLEKREGRWGIVLRQPIYEKDRMDPVTPGAVPVLDKALLEQFPPGYRHLAYLQTRIGYTVKRDMPGLKGPEVEALYARGAAWLKGNSI